MATVRPFVSSASRTFFFKVTAVGVLVPLAVEDEAHIDVVVAVQWHDAGVHRVAALMEVLEDRHVVAEVGLQRLHQRVALLAKLGFLVVFLELDGEWNSSNCFWTAGIWNPCHK